LHVGRKVMDTGFFAIAHKDEEQREVNARVHPRFLDAPSSAQQVIRDGLYVTNRRSLDLCQISAEVTDHISTFEIGRKPLEGPRPLAASRARAILILAGEDLRRWPQKSFVVRSFESFLRVGALTLMRRFTRHLERQTVWLPIHD